MVNREVLIEIWDEASMSDTSINAVVCRLLEERLPVMSHVFTAVTVTCQGLMSLFQRIKIKLGQRRLVHIINPCDNIINHHSHSSKVSFFTSKRLL
jgi:hypothetical protein